jgi:predicted TIM-barrel fold metal-dependent hydrolase
VHSLAPSGAQQHAGTSHVPRPGQWVSSAHCCPGAVPPTHVPTQPMREGTQRRSWRCTRSASTRYQRSTLKPVPGGRRTLIRARFAARESPVLPRLPWDGAVDADGHVLEPPDLWDRYLETPWRDRPMGVRRDADGLEYLEIAGRPSKMVRRNLPAGLGAMDLVGGIPPPPRWRTGLGYLDNAGLGAWDPAERLARLDQENLDVAILYPTLGVLWEAECEDLELAQAYTRAYNRWIVDFCRDGGGRLVPIAHLSLGVPEAAERELERAARDGVKGIFVAPFVMTRKAPGHPDHHRVFRLAEEIGLPVGIHPTFEPFWAAPGRFGRMTDASLSFLINVTSADAVRHAFTSMFQFAVPEKFPRLKLVVLESGAGWIGYWLERMDAVHASPLGRNIGLAEKPSAYFKRQCWISCDPDERSLAGVIPLVGEDRFFWASDFPHPDHAPRYLAELRELVELLPPSARYKLMSDNVRVAYGLPARAASGEPIAARRSGPMGRPGGGVGPQAPG